MPVKVAFWGFFPGATYPPVALRTSATDPPVAPPPPVAVATGYVALATGGKEGATGGPKSVYPDLFFWKKNLDPVPLRPLRTF